ncbi:MAG: hypothetical protein ACOC3J_05610, partial [Gemmatimonadota bacterium]
MAPEIAGFEARLETLANGEPPSEAEARALLEEAEARLREGPPPAGERELWWRYLALTDGPRYL